MYNCILYRPQPILYIIFSIRKPITNAKPVDEISRMNVRGQIYKISSINEEYIYIDERAFERRNYIHIPGAKGLKMI